MTQQTKNRPRDPRMPVGFQHQTSLPSDVKIEGSIGGAMAASWRKDCPLTERFFGHRDALRSEVTRVRNLAQKIDQKVKAGGQAARLHAGPALASAGRKALKELERRLEKMEADRQEAEGSLEGFWKETFSVRDNLVAAQVRDSLRSVPEKDRKRRLLEHLDDPDVASAVLRAPPLASGLSKKEHAALTREAERRHAPHLHRSRTLVSEAHERAMAAARVAEKMIAEMSGIERDRDGVWRAPWEIGDDD